MILNFTRIYFSMMQSSNTRSLCLLYFILPLALGSGIDHWKVQDEHFTPYSESTTSISDSTRDIYRGQIIILHSYLINGAHFIYF